MAIARCKGVDRPTPEQIKDLAVRLTEKALEGLGGIERFVKKGSVVFIKPNMSWDRTPEQAANSNPDVIATIDKTLVPFAVNALAQAAALAALEHDDDIARAVDAILAERARVEVELAAAGWTFPNHQANFVWLATAERTDEVTVELERRGVVVRPFSGEGIRVTIGTVEENDRFLAGLAEAASP
jgi:hypothetical protein